jgi:hypothetical protein
LFFIATGGEQEMSKVSRKFMFTQATRITKVLALTLLVLSCLVPVLVNPGAVYADDTFTKLPDPTTLPAWDSRGVAFSHDSSYMAVAHALSPFVTIYKKSGNTFTKLPNPTTLPTGWGWGAAFSPNSTYLAVAHDTTPFITIYKRSGDTFTKVADPPNLPAGEAHGVAFSPDSSYMAVAHVNSPFVTIYKIGVGDTFTKLTNPVTLPAGNGYGVAFSHDDTYMAVANGNSSPYVTIYKRSGDTFTKLTNPAILPTAQGNGIAFSHDSTYMTVAHDTTPFITIYKRSGDTFTKIANPATLPTGDGNGVAFSYDSSYMAVAHSVSPRVTIYNVQQPTQQVNSITGTGIVTFATSSGTITDLKAVDIPAEWKWVIPYHFPHGFFSFKITNISKGETVTVTITLPSATPMNTHYWKFSDTGQRWEMYALGRLGSNDGDNILTLTLTDGSPWTGDMDGAANGIIVDPGGPAVILAAALTGLPATLRASPTLSTQLKPAQMSLQYLSVNPKQAVANQPVTISTNVVNTGDEAGNLNIALKINGRVEQTRMVSVGPQGTQPVKFTLTRSQSGTYTVDIGDQKGSFTILGTGASTRAPVSGGLIALLVMAILVLTIVVVLMLSFRRPA